MVPDLRGRRSPPQRGCSVRLPGGQMRQLDSRPDPAVTRTVPAATHLDEPPSQFREIVIRNETGRSYRGRWLLLSGYPLSPFLVFISAIALREAVLHGCTICTS